MPGYVTISLPLSESFIQDWTSKLKNSQWKKPYELHEVPVPTVGETDLLVKTGAAGFCHTDYQVWEGVYKSPTPMIPSHEPVGTVVAVGSKVDDKWKVGQRVGAILMRHQCHTCQGCRVHNDIRHCENKDLAGLSADGGMAEYFIADSNNAVLLPDEVEFSNAAPLMCAGVSFEFYHGLNFKGKIADIARLFR